VTPVFRAPSDAEAAVMAALHIQCWNEVYCNIVPARLLEAADHGQRTAAWRANLDDAQKFVRAAYDGESPVGFIIAGPATDPAIVGADGHVLALYVLASHHGRGLGRRLMGAAAGWWLERGGTALGLGVLQANHRATAFYARLGGLVTRTGAYSWHDHALPDACYVFRNLAELARFA
jgi:GNAT superfamily N-acetyltransferase